MTVVDVLVETVARYADRPALTELATGRTVSYAALLAWTSDIARQARRDGIRPGHRVGLVAGNGLAHVPAAFGLLAAGACVVPIAPTLRAAEREAIVRETDVNAIMTVEAGKHDPTLAWIDMERGAQEGFAELDAAFVRFSSGTTAAEKGVILSHANVLGRVVAADRVLALSPEDRILWTLPLAYHFAVTIVGYLRAGAHVVLAEDSLPQSIAQAIRATRASVLYAGPIAFERIAQACGERLASVRLALSTAAPLSSQVADRFERATGVALGQAYGVIEAGLPCINTRQDGAPATSVGPPVPGYEVTVRDDGGDVCPGDVAGEVWVRGAGLFSGYYSPWQPPARVLTGGWFRTGDVGACDAAGRLTLLGRIKSTIIVAGMKVFPEEIEAVLDRVPGVRESRVVGVPHAKLGEVPVAEIVAEPGAQPEPRAVTAACAAVLSSHKVPVEIRIVAAVPKTHGGKVLRRPMKLTSRE